jgi:prolyl-tRNA synthetase
MVLADNGEDDIVFCKNPNCGYGANIEAAKSKDSFIQDDEVEMTAGEFHTPNIRSIDDLSQFFHIDKSYLVKAVVKKALYEDSNELVVYFIRGDDELQETKAQNIAKALELEDANEDDLKEADLCAGFIGPMDLKVKFFVDERLKNRDLMICGANKEDYHYVGYSFKDKDFEYCDLVSVKKGDECLKCGGELDITKGIEVGHIFQLGTTYSKALNATFLDRDGKAKPFVMGTYGMGVSRLVAVVVEQYHDDKGAIWTKSTAAFEYDIIISNIKDEDQRDFAEDLYQRLLDDGKSVILDDRAERFGFKMGDFELIGFPYAIIVGKGLKEGVVELVDRRTLNKETIPKDEIFDKIKEL